MDELFNLDYDNPDIRRLLKIYRRTRNRRIRNKLGKRLFNMCLDEKGFVQTGGVVYMRYDVYRDFFDHVSKLNDAAEHLAAEEV